MLENKVKKEFLAKSEYMQTMKDLNSLKSEISRNVHNIKSEFERMRHMLQNQIDEIC